MIYFLKENNVSLNQTVLENVTDSRWGEQFFVNLSSDLRVKLLGAE